MLPSRAPALHHRMHPEQDLLFHQMLAAFHGDAATWLRVNRGLRDAIVDHALARSPYYQRVIPPGADFTDIPILTKTVIRRHLEDLLCRGVPPDRRFPDKTSGSTGEPLAFYRDTAQLLIEESAAERFLRWMHGISFDAAAVKVVSTGHRYRLSRWDRVLRRGRRPRIYPSDYMVPITSLGPEDVAGELATWSQLGDYFLTGNVSGIHWIGEQINQRSLSIPRRPVAIATIGETLTEHARRRIQDTFEAPVHTRYASSEFRRIGTSLPGTIDRYVFNPFLVHVEVLGDSDRPVPAGMPGRLIITDLNNYVMPIIRYDTGHLAVPSPRGFIGGFPVIERILARYSEVLVLPSGKILSGVGVGSHLVRQAHLDRQARFYQCAQTGPNELELRVVWHGTPDEAVRARLAQSLHGIADPDTVVRVKDVDELDRLPSGKVWIVRREFEKG